MYGGVFALVVVCAVGALLMGVRADTESELRTMLSDSGAAQLAASAAQQSELFSQELGSATKAVDDGRKLRGVAGRKVRGCCRDGA